MRYDVWAWAASVPVNTQVPTSGPVNWPLTFATSVRSMSVPTSEPFPVPVNGVVSAFAFPASAALVSQTVPAEIRRQAEGVDVVLRLLVGEPELAELVDELGAQEVVLTRHHVAGRA